MARAPRPLPGRGVTVRSAAATTLLALLLTAGCTAPPGGAPAGAATSGAGSAQSSTSPAPTPAPSPVDPDVAAAEAALARLDARQRAEQLLVVGVPATDPASGDALLASTPYGGVFLRGRSTAAAADVGAVTTAWAQAARDAGRPVPWVSADQEGGAVQTFSGEGFADLPTARTQGRGTPDEVRATARGTGESLRTAGVSLDLSPVADVVPEGTARGNAPVGRYGREYGTTAEAVSEDAGAVVAGLGEAGVTATVKHFPGLGRVTRNTDTSADVRDTATTADDPDVAVFGELAALPERPFVMVSSATYEQIDPSAVAAFSPVVVQQLLRERLGFDGVVITDDVGEATAMADVPVGERATRSVAAGVTLVLTIDADLAPAMVDALLERAAADPAFAAQLDAAVRTALLAKARAGLLP